MKKIIEKADPIKCDRCGCKFEYELSDVKFGYNYASGKHCDNYVTCPHCGKPISL